MVLLVLGLFLKSRNILHDPEMYPSPSEFKPERFLQDNNGRTAKDPAVNGAFGYGRRYVKYLYVYIHISLSCITILNRICAGRNLADASIWIAIASILSTFEIQQAVDENGEKIDVSGGFSGAHGLFK